MNLVFLFFSVLPSVGLSKHGAREARTRISHVNPCHGRPDPPCSVSLSGRFVGKCLCCEGGVQSDDEFVALG